MTHLSGCWLTKLSVLYFLCLSPFRQIFYWEVKRDRKQGDVEGVFSRVVQLLIFVVFMFNDKLMDFKSLLNYFHTFFSWDVKCSYSHEPDYLQNSSICWVRLRQNGTSWKMPYFIVSQVFCSHRKLADEKEENIWTESFGGLKSIKTKQSCPSLTKYLKVHRQTCFWLVFFTPVNT